MIARLLVDLGADRSLLNKFGKTALICAEESFDTELAKQKGKGATKKRGATAGAATRFEKGSLIDRLNATVDFLYEKEGRSRG